MTTLNQVNLIGRLGADPEKNGPAVRLSLATNSKSGDKELTEWHRCVAFNQNAEFAEKFLHRGSQVYVMGKLRTNKWTDKNGSNHYTTEILIDRLLSLSKDSSVQPPSQNKRPMETENKDVEDINEDIPF